jgi:hypothetical protein
VRLTGPGAANCGIAAAIGGGTKLGKTATGAAAATVTEVPTAVGTAAAGMYTEAPGAAYIDVTAGDAAAYATGCAVAIEAIADV